jgi:hypothetical protein
MTHARARRAGTRTIYYSGNITISRRTRRRHVAAFAMTALTLACDRRYKPDAPSQSAAAAEPLAFARVSQQSLVR